MCGEFSCFYYLCTGPSEENHRDLLALGEERLTRLALGQGARLPMHSSTVEPTTTAAAAGEEGRGEGRQEGQQQLRSMSSSQQRRRQERLSAGDGLAMVCLPSL